MAIFFRSVSQCKKIKTKINKWDLIKQSKGNHKQNKMTTYEMGENICKQCHWQGLSFQNIQTANIAQFKKNTHTIKKWAEYLNKHFSKEYV